MLALAGHMAMSMCHPFLLALLGLLPFCKPLKGRMAEVHVTPLLLTLTGPCILGWGLWGRRGVGPCPPLSAGHSVGDLLFSFKHASPCGVHGEVHVSPLLLALWGPGSACWGLRRPGGPGRPGRT